MLQRLLLVTLAALIAACNEGSAETRSTIEVSAATRPTPDGVKDIPLNLHILVDQFGYRPGDPKVAVIRSPEQGFDVADKFKPGDLYEVRPVSGGDAVYIGGLDQWGGGLAEESSGDRGWWFDFSTVTAPGEYVIVDTKLKQRSAVFAIRDDVYQPVLKAAMRMFFYQRSGFRKDAKYAGACWADEAAYAAPFQDLEARAVNDPDNPTLARDMSGGWFDAGDTNKYVTFAVTPVHQLLSSWQDYPAAFGDDLNIPESGNGLPDVIDEVDYEIDWLMKMQNPDGSVALKVGALEPTRITPPSKDEQRRYYIPSCTSSTIAAAGMFAHAAAVYRQFPALEKRATQLEIRAIKAWDNYHKSDIRQTSCDVQKIQAGDADRTTQEQSGMATLASIYLYAVTGEAKYQDYLRAYHRQMRPYRDSGWSRYDSAEGEALLYYTGLANADPLLRDSIKADKTADVDSGNGVYEGKRDDDLYRAFLHPEQYHWGSNQPRANYGNSNVDAVIHGLAGKKADALRARALGILNYFHGVNPFGMVYLSNMASYGATRSVDSLFHTWFRNKSKWSRAGESECGPAPGYLPGGPNRAAIENGVPPKFQPPANQPPQKSFKATNDTAEAAWAISEPAIYYQSGYVRLLAAFATAGSPAAPAVTEKPAEASATDK